MALTTEEALHQLAAGFSVTGGLAVLEPGQPLPLTVRPPAGLGLAALTLARRPPAALAAVGGRPRVLGNVAGGLLATAGTVLEDLPPEVEEVLGSLDVTAELAVGAIVDGEELGPADRSLAVTATHALALAAAPAVVEPGAPGARRALEVTVRVTLRADGEAATVRLPPVAALLEPLPLPTTLALFRHREFRVAEDGFVLLVAPRSSGVTGERAGALLEALPAGPAARLRAIPALRHLADVLAALHEHVTAQPRARLLVADQVPNLNRIEMLDRRGVRHDTEAEEQVSALLLVGPPGRTVELYCRRELREGAGRLDVGTGPGLVASLPDLGTLEHRLPGVALPADAGPVVDPVEASSRPHGFNDAVRSLVFA